MLGVPRRGPDIEAGTYLTWRTHHPGTRMRKSRPSPHAHAYAPGRRRRGPPPPPLVSCLSGHTTADMACSTVSLPFFLLCVRVCFVTWSVCALHDSKWAKEAASNRVDTQNVCVTRETCVLFLPARSCTGGRRFYPPHSLKDPLCFYICLYLKGRAQVSEGGVVLTLCGLVDRLLSDWDLLPGGGRHSGIVCLRQATGSETAAFCSS